MDPVADASDSARPGPSGRRFAGVALATSVRIGFLLVVVGAAGWALASRWPEVVGGFARVSALPMVAAALLAIAGSWLAAFTWCYLLGGLGSRLPMRQGHWVFFVGQLGKYVPGGVWSILAQVSLARDFRVPRVRSGTAGILTLVVGVITSAVISAVTLAIAGRAVLGAYAWALLIVLPMIIFLHPALLEWATSFIGRALHRQLDLRRIPGGTLLRAALWQVGGQLTLGMHLWLVIGSVSGHYPSLLLAVGLFNVAWVAGLVVIIAPAGAGVREAVLILGLSPMMDPGSALLVALLSRVLSIAADFVLAGVVSLARPKRRAADSPTP